jgi:hypothetical protein
MFKTVLLSAAIVLTGSAAVAAIPSAIQQQKNFITCKEADSSWMRRFGNYVIAFDYIEASDYCHRWAWPANGAYRQAGCFVDRTYLKAGYFCQKQSPR